MSEPLYYAKNQTVFKSPVETTKPDGTRAITMGFPVCTMSEYLSAGAAEAVAELMSQGERVPAMEGALRRARQCLVDAIGTLAGTAVVDARRAIAAIDAALAEAKAADGGEG